MKEVRIIVAGSRTFSDFEMMEKKLLPVISYYTTHYKDYNICIVSGKAIGADAIGEQYAAKHQLKLYEFPADWDRLGSAAGIIRNEQMADFAVEGDCIGVLCAFWNATSRGTKHMIKTANRYKIDTHIFYF